MASILGNNRRYERPLSEKIWHLGWALIFLVAVISAVGFAMLYSAANGSIHPWAVNQMIRFGVGLSVMVTLAMVDIRTWMRWSYPIYGVMLFMLAGVELYGEIGMGAQRWIDLGVVRLQPSELMKIAMVLALARYFHGLQVEDVGRLSWLVPPALIVLTPAFLVLRQPDLGTAGMLMLAGAAMFFIAGVRAWLFVVIGVAGLAAIPVGWQMLREYQRQRVLTFLNPETDPLGSGYHILQSKIALGSGGMFGKGFLQGTQSHLNFLPERQTDFIFTMLAEEFGLVGGVALIAMYTLVIAYGVAIGLWSRNHFGRLLAMGVTTTIFLYVFINIAMVTGLIPVVGVPLPLISYGGTAMLTIMIGLGLMMSVLVHRDTFIGRRGPSEDD
ncbi:MAG: rod shape-determining protein RodA [Acetobacterales bacterium]